MIWFNFDNFGYIVFDLIFEGEVQGLLNFNFFLYQFLLFFIEYNLSFDGVFVGFLYVYGILIDNILQMFVNFCQGDQYYFGVFYGEFDYYFFVGRYVVEVFSEFVQLIGCIWLKFKYVFGYYQGGYGLNYNIKWKLLEVVFKYWQWKILIDGFYVDVDL